MEDPWGTSAWSTTHSEKNEDYKETLDPPKWNTFERDADENTIDVGVPSWSVASGSGWGEGTNLWHAESSTLDAWKPSLSINETREDSEVEPEEHTAQEQEEDDKFAEPRPILPTPPLSPLPVLSVTPPVAETPPSSSPRPSSNPPSPDPFGSFESAEVVSEESPYAASWTPKTPQLPSEGTDGPWGDAWGGSEEGGVEGPKDEWELAQEAKRKRDRKVPPELLDSLVKQWEVFAANLYPKLGTEQSESHSWRKGLDSIDGLTELVDSLTPITSFPPPTPFNKTAVAKSVKETLRLTRSFPMTQSSPMAHLHASKGSTDWEKSVKAQKAAANDEWGWDLKHEPEEKQETADSVKDKKGGGLLSFWNRKASSIPSTPTGDILAPNPPKSPTAMSKPTSPATSGRPSIDSSRIASPTTTTLPNSPALAADVDTASAETASAQPSVVSRFFNRFSRKPSAVSTAPSGKDKHTSLSLSSDDLSFLSDMTPSTSEGSLQRESASVNSLEAMLSWPTKIPGPNSNKLPPPLAPPPGHSSRPTGHKSTSSQGSDTSFDGKMVDAQFMDLLDTAMGGGPSSNSGYTPVTIDLEPPVESKGPFPALQSPESPIHRPPTSFQPPVISPISSTSRYETVVPSPTPWPAPMISPQHNAQDSHTLTSNSLPPIPPSHTPDRQALQQSIALARVHDPLPPTPKRGLDDFADFLSISSPSGRRTPPHSLLLPPPGSSSSTQVSTTTSFISALPSQFNSVHAANVDDSVDYGDFGDFISTPIRTPSPPKVPQKPFKSTDHKSTLELVENAVSRPGRWPAPPSPLPRPLAPPPGSSSDLEYFNKSPTQPSQLDLLTSDSSPAKATSESGAFSAPSQAAAFPQLLFASPPSPSPSTALGMSPAPLPATLASRTTTPSLPPKCVPSKPAGASGLSAQDLSFFEGL